MVEEKVAAEVAEQEYSRFLEMMDLTEKVAGKTKSAEAKESYEEVKGVVLLAMRRGNLVIDADGQAVFTPQLGDRTPIVFPEPLAEVRKALDQVKGSQSQERAFLLLSKWTGQVRARFEKMRQRDFSVCEALTSLFFI